PLRRPHAQGHGGWRHRHHRPGARAHLRRQGLSRPRLRPTLTRLPLRPEARAYAPYQAQLEASLRHRAGDRPHEGGRTARAQLPQQPARRSSQRHPLRRRPERPPPAQMVRASFALVPGLALQGRLLPTVQPGLSRSYRQNPFFTDDWVKTRPEAHAQSCPGTSPPFSWRYLEKSGLAAYPSIPDIWEQNPIEFDDRPAGRPMLLGFHDARSKGRTCKGPITQQTAAIFLDMARG